MIVSTKVQSFGFENENKVEKEDPESQIDFGDDADNDNPMNKSDRRNFVGVPPKISGISEILAAA